MWTNLIDLINVFAKNTNYNCSVAYCLGILLYEMLYGRTPFRGKNRQKTFANVLYKDLTFPSSIQVRKMPCFFWDCNEYILSHVL